MICNASFIFRFSGFHDLSREMKGTARNLLPLRPHERTFAEIMICDTIDHWKRRNHTERNTMKQFYFLAFPSNRTPAQFPWKARSTTAIETRENPDAFFLSVHNAKSDTLKNEGIANACAATLTFCCCSSSRYWRRTAVAPVVAVETDKRVSDTGNSIRQFSLCCPTLVGLAIPAAPGTNDERNSPR